VAHDLTDAVSGLSDLSHAPTLAFHKATGKIIRFLAS
jgi:hypothetical protein